MNESVHAARSDTLRASVTRYTVSRFRLFQSIWPGACIAGIVARRSPGVTSSVLAGALLLICIGLLASSRRRVRSCNVQVVDRTLDFDGALPAFETTEVTSWAADDRRIRLHSPEFGWTLLATAGDRLQLQQALERHLPPPAILARRGSARARAIALVLGVTGLLVVPVAISMDSIPLLLAGMLVGVAGLTTLAALSQRGVRPTTTRTMAPTASRTAAIHRRRGWHG